MLTFKKYKGRVISLISQRACTLEYISLLSWKLSISASKIQVEMGGGYLNLRKYLYFTHTVYSNINPWHFSFSSYKLVEVYPFQWNISCEETWYFPNCFQGRLSIKPLKKKRSIKCRRHQKKKEEEEKKKHFKYNNSHALLECTVQFCNCTRQMFSSICDWFIKSMFLQMFLICRWSTCLTSS